MSEQKKYYLLLVLIAASVAPLPFIVAPPTPDNWTSLSLYISSVLGYGGIVLLLWMYILGAKSVIGLYLRDIARVTKLHSFLGKYGVLLIFAHPLAAAIAYGQNLLLYSLVPSLSSQFEMYVTFGRIAFYALLLIWLTSAIVRGKIAYRPWKYIHYVAYIALPFSLLHIPTIGVSYQTQTGARFYFLSVIAIYVLFSLLRIRQLFALGKASFIVESHIQVTSDIMMLQLTANSGRRLDAKRGQYIFLQTNLLGEEHPFSVLQYDDKTGNIAIAYKTFGSFTRKLSNLQSGAQVFLDGPYGTFTEQFQEAPNHPAVFIAGGIGITPFVDHILHNSSAEQWLFYANRTKDSSAFSDVLQKKLTSRYVSILSGDTTLATTNDERGYINTEIFQKYLTRPTRYNYYVCGPQPMMDNAKQSLLDAGIPARQIFVEEFSF